MRPAPPSVTKRPLVAPGMVRGIMTERSPMAMPEGFYPLLQNVRPGNGVLTVRNGTVSLGTILASGTFRGCWTTYILGSYTMFVAVKSGSAVRVYYSTTGASWTEATTSSGAYGDTRLSDTGELVHFALVKDPLDSEPCVVVNDGTSDPRVIQLTTSCAKHVAVEAPTATRDFPVRLTFQDFLPLKDAANTTYVVSTAAEFNGADATLTGGASTTDNVIRITIDSTANSDETVRVNFAAAKDLNGGQFCVGLDTAYIEFWDRVKLDIVSGSTVVHTLWDPTNPSTTSAPVPVPCDLSQKTLWMFDVQGLVNNTTTSFDGIQLTYKNSVGPAPTSDQTADIFLLAVTGKESGQTQWAITTKNSGSRAESPGVVFSVYETEEIRNLGGPTLAGLKIPNDERIKFRYRIPYKNVSTTERDAGVNYHLIYRKRPEDFQFTHYATEVTSTYAGSWSYASSGTDVKFYVANLGLDYEGRVALPDGLHKPIPKGRGTEFLNGRLFVGGTVNGQNTILFSEYGHPFRFREVTRFDEAGNVDEYSPSFIRLNNEIPQRIIGITGARSGVGNGMIFTDQAVYSFYGILTSQISQAGRIAPWGTVSPFSVVEHEGAVFWLARDMQVRRIAGGTDEISAGVVADEFRGIPASRRKFVFGAWFDQMYRLAYTPSGQSLNTKVLVWDARTGAWISKDAPPKNPDGLLTWFDNTNQKERLVMFALDSSDLKAYAYDDSGQSQDLSADIAVAVTTPEYFAIDKGKYVHIRRLGIFCDACPGQTATYVRTYKPDGRTATSTASIAAASGQIATWDGAQTLSPVTDASRGPSVQVAFTASMPAGTRIYHIQAEFDEVQDGRAG